MFLLASAPKKKERRGVLQKSTVTELMSTLAG